MLLISKISSASVENCVLASLSDGEMLREACFSADGTAVAFIAARDARHWVRNANGTRAAYDDARNLVVGPGGETTACVARLGHNALVPINGAHQQAFRWVSEPVLGLDGKKVSVAAGEGTTLAARWVPSCYRWFAVDRHQCARLGIQAE
jgi:hypothetical protein